MSGARLLLVLLVAGGGLWFVRPNADDDARSTPAPPPAPRPEAPPAEAARPLPRALLEARAASGARRDALLAAAAAEPGLLDALAAHALPGPLEAVALEALAAHDAPALRSFVAAARLDAPPEALRCLALSAGPAADDVAALLLDLFAEARRLPGQPLLPAIARALGLLGHPGALQPLADALCDEDERRLGLLAHALAAVARRHPHLGAEAVLQALATRTPSPVQRAWAHAVLGELGTPAALEGLHAAVIDALEPSAEAVAVDVEAAVHALARGARPGLELLLDLEERAAGALRLRVIAAMAAAARGTPERALVARALRERLHDELAQAGEGPASDALARGLALLEPEASPAPPPAVTRAPPPMTNRAALLDLCLAGAFLGLTVAVGRRWRRGGTAAAALLALSTLGAARPTRAQDLAPGALAADLDAFAEGRLDAAGLRERLAASGPDALADLGRLLAARDGPAEALPVVAATPGGARVLAGLLRSERLASAAVTALATIGTSGADPLLEAVTGEGIAPPVRQGAAAALGAIFREDPAAFAPWRARVVEAAQRVDGDPDVADAALRALVEVDRWDAADVLVRRLDSPRRRPALTIAALLPTASPAAQAAHDHLQAVVVAIATSAAADPIDRGLAVQALGVWGDERCVPELVNLLESDLPGAHEAIHRALTRLTGEVQASAEGWRIYLAGAAWRERRIQALVDAARAPGASSSRRELALRELGRLRHPLAVDVLLEHLRGGPPEPEALVCCLGLAWQGDHRAVPVLRAVRDDPAASPQLRARAAWALSALGAEDPRAKAAPSSAPVTLSPPAWDRPAASPPPAAPARPAPDGRAPAAPSPSLPLDWTPRRVLIVVVGACLLTLAGATARHRHVRRGERAQLLAALEAAQRERLALERAARERRDQARATERRRPARRTQRFDGAISWEGPVPTLDVPAVEDDGLRAGLAALRAAEEAAARPEAPHEQERERLLREIRRLERELDDLRTRLALLDASTEDGRDVRRDLDAALGDDAPEEQTADVYTLRAQPAPALHASEATVSVPTSHDAPPLLDLAPDLEPEDLTVDVALARAPEAEPTVALERSDPPADDGDTLAAIPASRTASGAAPSDDDTLTRAPASPPRPSEPPRIASSEFEVLGPLGRGSQGSVWEAVDPTGRRVALKLLPGPADEESLARLAREAELCRRIDSPHVVRVHGLHTAEDGRPYLSMALVRGCSAMDLMRQRGPLPVDEVARIGEHVARALAATAALGVVHRDVKPSNIVVGDDGVATLVDFGIGKEEGAASPLTRTGISLGTVHYMAPEQLLDARSATARSDVYALGATLFHLLTGRPAVHGDVGTVVAASFAELVGQLARQRPELRALRPDCPPALERLLERMLRAAPDERPTAAEVVDAFERMRAERVTPPA